MAIHSGFFNALESGGVYDRGYDASDYSDNMGAIISSGVRRSGDDDLKVTANGLTLKVGIGRAWINGHWLNNDTVYTVATVTAPVGTSRIDGVFVRLDTNTSVRAVSIVYREGTYSAAPAPVRTGGIYELMLAKITVAEGATNVTVKDMRPNKTVCGWVTTPVGYDDYFTSLDNEFDVWFDAMKGQLSEDAAGNLQNQINIQNYNISKYAPVELYSWNGTDAQAEGDKITLSQDATDFEKLVVEYTEGVGENTNNALSVASVYIPETLTADLRFKLSFSFYVGEVSPSGEVKIPCSSSADWKLKTSALNKLECVGRNDEELVAIKIVKVLGYGNRNAPPIVTEPYNETQVDNITTSVQEVTE